MKIVLGNITERSYQKAEQSKEAFEANFIGDNLWPIL